MTSVRIKAKKEVYYASKTRNAGDEFDATESDAKILVGIDTAEYVKDEQKSQSTQQPRQRQTLENRSLESQEPEKTSEKLPESGPMTSDNAGELTESGKKRRYLRRDMQAKE